jgi:hypothetical protein
MSVYFIRAGRYFKIGSSDDPQRRLERLTRSGTRYTFPADAPIGLHDRELYATVPGDLDAEAAVHSALDDFSVGLEWFLDEPEVRALADHLVSIGHVPRPLAKVERPTGWCRDEYDAVQQGRADREVARYVARRAS